MANARNASIEHAREPDEPLVEIVLMDGALSDEFVLSRPVRVEVWIESGEYVADVADFNLHAFGATREEALLNVRAQIVEQRQRLLVLRDRISPLMRQDAMQLEVAVVPRHA